jgi:DNA topoisomerase II
MGRADECEVGNAANEDFTAVTFEPDLDRFHMAALDDDIVSLSTRRAYDVAATSGAKVYLNGKRLPITKFQEYVGMFTKGRTDEDGNEMRVAYERVNERWEVACTVSDAGFQQLSFVNNITTTKGGTHIDYVADQIIKKLLEIIKKKSGKDAVRNSSLSCY